MGLIFIGECPFSQKYARLYLLRLSSRQINRKILKFDFHAETGLSTNPSDRKREQKMRVCISARELLGFRPLRKNRLLVYWDRSPSSTPSNPSRRHTHPRNRLNQGHSPHHHTP